MDDKTAKYTNRLINETSPYLLQHAHNPVEWYSWGEEAFEKAKTEDKPVLLSIGYSACHWCHVMERESFENEDIAELMNKNFVNIKVDLEERPDVDKIYMQFVQLTAGNGGYPLNVFLTPDQRPFFGGTYFPPEPRYNMPSFSQILTSVSEAYQERRDDVLRSANDILGEIRRIGIPGRSEDVFGHDELEVAYQSFVRSFDRVNGGFGGAPKFPAPMTLEFLLRYYHRTGETEALRIVKFSCDKMAHGGIYDQLGGGFHRYTVDTNWLTPHFEKMLYDNAQLIKIYLHLFQVTKDEFYKQTAVDSLEYVIREMTDVSGGFYSAQDADSEGIEGKFFVWTPDEIAEILGEEDARIFEFFYDVSETGNFEGQNILNVKNSIAETAQTFGISEDELVDKLSEFKEKVFTEREKRVKPFRDEKVLTAWNGLMLSAFAEAYAILKDKRYLEVAIKNADFLLESLKDESGLLRTWKDGKSSLNAYIEDYANLAEGLFDLFQVSGEVRYLKKSKKLADDMVDEFWDEEGGGFFFTSKGHEELLIRTKDFYDNATPSGNSAAVDIFLKLSKVFGEEKYLRYATGILRLVSSQIRRFPGAFGKVLSALEFYNAPVKEIVVIGDKGNVLADFLWEEFIPFKVTVVAEDSSDSSYLGLLEGREMVDGKPTAYVCENFTCQVPATDVDSLRDQLGLS